MSRSAAHGRHQDTAAVLRNEVSRLRQSLDRIGSALEQLEAAETTSAARNRPDRYYRLLVDVYEYGRHGTASPAFADLGRSRGYDAGTTGRCSPPRATASWRTISLGRRDEQVDAPAARASCCGA